VASFSDPKFIDLPPGWTYTLASDPGVVITPTPTPEPAMFWLVGFLVLAVGIGAARKGTEIRGKSTHCP
jgi:hypothetical protein